MFVLLSGTDIGHIPPLGLNMTTKAGMVGACLVVRELMEEGEGQVKGKRHSVQRARLEDNEKQPFVAFHKLYSHICRSIKLSALWY